MKKSIQGIRRLAVLCFAALCLLTALPLTVGASGEPGMKGDISLDGRINSTDYVLLKRYVLGTYSLDAAQKQCADLNGDSKINSTDYIILKRAVMGTYSLPGTGTQTPSTGDSTEASAKVQEVLRLVNMYRAQNGLAALTLSDKLCELATLKAEDMVANGYFDHTSPTYGSPFEMMRQFGVTYSSAGENIAYGQRTPEEVMDAWMNSPGHRANILGESYTEIGIGIAVGSNGIHWVQMFRRP